MDKDFILLVEDNQDDIDLTLRAFRKSNIVNKVIVAHDGMEAIDFIYGSGANEDRGAGGMPALILLDLKLPKMSGLEVLERLRADECTRFLPVVILTSSKEEQDLAAGYGLGANSYIRKPVDFERFVDAVQQVGLYWLVLNEPPPHGRRQNERE